MKKCSSCWWSGARRAAKPAEASVQQLFEAQAARRPEAVALVFGEQKLSYRELNEGANQLARYLRQLGVGPEVAVGIGLERSAEMVLAWLAVLKAGGAYVPLEVSYPAERLAYMIEDAGLQLVLTQAELKLGITQEVIELPRVTTRLISLERERAEIEKQERTNLEVEVRAENLAYVIYTSGSTGQPKGVAVPQGGLLNLVRWHQEYYQVSGEDRGAQLAAIAFDASGWEVWSNLSSGASVAIADEETRVIPEQLISWLQQEEITIAFVPTPLAEALMREPWPAELKLKRLLVGGDRLHRHSVRSLGFELYNNYGPTENTVVATCGKVDLQSKREPSIGGPISNTEVYVLGTGLEPLPVGVAGELYIGGSSLARGYLNRPELTAAQFVPHPFSRVGGERLYRTGDQARWLDSKELEFLGRKDHQVNLRGIRIELGEVEAVLVQYWAVQEAVAEIRSNGTHEQQLVAYIVAEEGVAPTKAELRTYLREKLPQYMIPTAFVTLPSLPLTASGKLDRAALPVPESLAREIEGGYVAPRNEVEKLLAEIWGSVLGAGASRCPRQLLRPGRGLDLSNSGGGQSAPCRFADQSEATV